MPRTCQRSGATRFKSPASSSRPGYRRCVLASRTAAEVADLVRSVLAEDVFRAEHLPTGFGNENWRLTLSSGARCVAKFGPLSSEAKWRSSQEAHRLAVSAGVPVPRLVHFECLADGILRIFEWVDGSSPAAIASEGRYASRFFSDLGRAVGALHSVEAHTFEFASRRVSAVLRSLGGLCRVSTRSNPGTMSSDQHVRRCRPRPDQRRDPTTR